MRQAPELPYVYELVVRDAVDSAMDEARRLARAGAGEGTLVWAQEQTSAHDSSGRPQPSPRGNLYACLILQPEYPPVISMQLSYVAVVSLGQALANLALPMTDLRYVWPNAVQLSGSNAGAIMLEFVPRHAENFPALLVDVKVNVKSHSAVDDIGSTSLEAEGLDGVSAVEVLEGFARYFVSWINRWADAGFDPVQKTWMQRMEGLGEIREMRLKEKTLTGKLVELDGRGALIVESADGVRHTLSVADYYGLEAGRETGS